MVIDECGQTAVKRTGKGVKIGFEEEAVREYSALLCITMRFALIFGAGVAAGALAAYAVLHRRVSQRNTTLDGDSHEASQAASPGSAKLAVGAGGENVFALFPQLCGSISRLFCTAVDVLKEEQLSRNRLFFGDDGQLKIEGSFVIVVGLGGVGACQYCVCSCQGRSHHYLCQCCA